MLFDKMILNSYKRMMHTRCDDTETVFYFSAEDFEGLRRESYPFKASAGHTLQGYIYQYENPIPKRLVVFDHGFGGGHRAYMKEIELLCRRGYTVFSYDHTGCMESGGDTPNGMAQSLCDLNDCITAIKSDARFAGIDLSVMGHSWGGFSTLNISALHPEISHVVVLSGFVSVSEMIKTFIPDFLKGYRRVILDFERRINPKFADRNAVESLKNSNVKALLIYSADDPLVPRRHFDLLREGLAGRENVDFMLCNGKGHNPNYTADAIKLLGAFGRARAKLLKNRKATRADKERFVSSFDWNAITAQDESVWQAIFDHLEK
jgi:pimeloyl-ACP methyl ester carboxylesterase